MIVHLWGGPHDGSSWPVDDLGKELTTEDWLVSEAQDKSQLRFCVYDYDVHSFNEKDQTITARFRESKIIEEERVE